MSTVVSNEMVGPVSVVVSTDAPGNELMYVCTAETGWQPDPDVVAGNPDPEQDRDAARLSKETVKTNRLVEEQPSTVPDRKASAVPPADRSRMSVAKVTAHPPKTKTAVAKVIVVPAKAIVGPTTKGGAPHAPAAPLLTIARAVAKPVPPRIVPPQKNRVISPAPSAVEQSVDQQAAVPAANARKRGTGTRRIGPSAAVAAARAKPAAKQPVQESPKSSNVSSKSTSAKARHTHKRAASAPMTPAFCAETVAPNITPGKKTAPSKKRPAVKPADLRKAGLVNGADVGVTAVTLSEPKRLPQKTYGEWFKEKVVESKWATSFFAFYTHWLLLILLAIIVVHGPNHSGDFIITASTAIPIEYEPVQVLDTRIVEPEPEVAQPQTQATTTAPMDMSVTKPALPDALAAALSDGDPEEVADAKPVYSQTPAMLPRNAISKGSFSVWTIPENPDPGESYTVMIRAKVPDGCTRYPVTDLQGVVIGSDGYRKLIPGSMRGFLPIQGGYVHFEVPIVAADQEIRDTVWIQSRMLKEQQKLLIEF